MTRDVYVKSGLDRPANKSPSEWRFAGEPIATRDGRLAGYMPRTKSAKFHTFDVKFHLLSLLSYMYLIAIGQD